MAKKKKKKSGSKSSYDAKKKAAKSASQIKAEKAEQPELEAAGEKPAGPEIIPEIKTQAAPEIQPAPEPEQEPVVLPDYMAAPQVTVPHTAGFTGEDFEKSVNEIRPEDIMTEGEKKKKHKKKKMSRTTNIITAAALCVFGTILIVSIVMLSKNIWGKIRGSDIYSEASDKFSLFTSGDASEEKLYSTAMINYLPSGAMQTLYERIASGKTESSSGSGEYAQKLAEMKASLTALKSVNAEVYGWIYVENTNINYPLMHGTDNNYYLDHAYTGEFLPIGSIFMDYLAAEPICENYNTIIYGHNVVTGGKGGMFHDVTKFLDADFFAANKIYIYTMDGVYIYKPVSVYPTTSEYQYYLTDFATEESFAEYANKMVQNSKVASGESFSAGDRMITFSTCTNGAQNGRYALHAKLVETIK